MALKLKTIETIMFTPISENTFFPIFSQNWKSMNFLKKPFEEMGFEMAHFHIQSKDGSHVELRFLSILDEELFVQSEPYKWVQKLNLNPLMSRLYFETDEAVSAGLFDWGVAVDIKLKAEDKTPQSPLKNSGPFLQGLYLGEGSQIPDKKIRNVDILKAEKSDPFYLTFSIKKECPLWALSFSQVEPGFHFIQGPQAWDIISFEG